MKKFRRKVLDMLMSNNSGSSLRQQLFDSAPFCSELLYTAIPQRAASGTTGTFTRATTSTWQNNDGYQVTGVAGEIGFPGARRVRNLLASVANLLSEDITSAGWTANAVTKAVGSITETAASSLHYISNNAVGTIGRKHIYQMRASLGSGTRLLWTGDGVTVAEFNLQAGTAAVVAGSGSASMTLVSTGVYDCYLTINSQAATVVNIGLASSTGVYNYAGNGTSSINVSWIQLEDVTAQTTQTAGEYVSVGVVQRNLLTNSNKFDLWTQSNTPTPTQNLPAPSGIDCDGGWTLTDNMAGAAETVYTSCTLTNGVDYKYSAFIAKTTGAQASYPLFYCGFTAGGKVAWATVDTTNGIATIWTAVTGYTVVSSSATCVSHDSNYWRVTITFTGTSELWYFQLVPAGTTNPTQSTGTIDLSAPGSAGFAGAMLTLATADQTYQPVGGTYQYHGSFVDGVKCFPTDISGNPIPSTTLLGYQAQGARTNLCLQSNAFTTTWTASGTPSLSQNAIGPNGQANYAWSITDANAGALAYVTQSTAMAAATYTDSVLVKKTTGVQTAYPVMYANTGTNAAFATLDTTNGIATIWTALTGNTIVTSSARMTSYNSDFWLAELTYLATAATWFHYLIPAGTTNPTQSSGSADVTAQATHVFCNFQVELGSFASSYIATTTVAVTRNADVLTYFGGDITNIKTLAAIGFKRESGVSVSGYVCALSDNTTNELAASYLNTATQHRFNGWDGGVNQWETISSNAYTPGQLSSIAWSMATNDIKMAKDGVAQTQDTSATVPTTTQLDVGHIAGGNQLSGNVGGIYGWTRNLSQSELNAVTA